MNKMKVLFAILVTTTVGMAQSVNISGKVTDSAGIAISGATVRLEKGGQSTVSGTDGNFTLTGAARISEHMIQPLSPRISARISNGILYVNVPENLPVEISAYNLQGKMVYRLQKQTDAATHAIALPNLGPGIYLYTVKSDNDRILIKNISCGSVSGGTAFSFQPPSINSLSKRAKAADEINDVVAVSKDGYLNYREMLTTSDTSGMEIKMIVCVGTVTDTDGNVYQAVKIGNQIWMVENLQTTRYNDGSAIPLAGDSAAWASMTPGYCYYNNTINADSIKKMGAIYNWYAVTTSKLAPKGWHVPADSEWDALQNYMIVNGYNWDGTTTGNKIAKALAAKAGWSLFLSSAGAIGTDLTKNNRSGFSAFPGGMRYGEGNFDEVGIFGYWWSASESDEYLASYRNLNNYAENLFSNSGPKWSGFSVRLLKDNPKPLQLLQPVAGASFKARMPVTIQWEINDPAQIASVEVDLSIDNGKTYLYPLRNYSLPPDTTKIIWTPAVDQVSTQCVIKVKCYENASIFDKSGIFSVSN